MDVKGVRGLILSDSGLIDILKEKFKKHISRVEKVSDGYKVFFDPSEDVNAIILGPEDLIKILTSELKRNVISVDEGKHDEYIIRFRD